MLYKIVNATKDTSHLKSKCRANWKNANKKIHIYKPRNRKGSRQGHQQFLNKSL